MYKIIEIHTCKVAGGKDVDAKLQRDQSKFDIVPDPRSRRRDELGIRPEMF
jgi:hypothetical protein